MTVIFKIIFATPRVKIIKFGSNLAQVLFFSIEIEVTKSDDSDYDYYPNEQSVSVTNKRQKLHQNRTKLVNYASEYCKFNVFDIKVAQKNEKVEIISSSQKNK